MKPSSEGEITYVSLIAVLQSLQLAKLTGRLDLEYLDLRAHAYFIDGTPVHAQMENAVGDEALIEIAMWEKGHFKLFPNQEIAKVTIHSRLDTLIIAAAVLFDKQAYLDSIGASKKSILCRTGKIEIDELLPPATEADRQLAIAFYHSIDNNASLAELIDKSKLRKTKYIPILHELFKCGLVGIKSKLM